jgi:hypothetical protein
MKLGFVCFRVLACYNGPAHYMELGLVCFRVIYEFFWMRMCCKKVITMSCFLWLMVITLHLNDCRDSCFM